jgi:hypothetical protein
LSTALATRPAPGAPDLAGTTPVHRRGPLRRLGALRHTTPGRLQLVLGTLLALGLLTGLVAGLGAQSARSGTADLGGRAQPLLAEAETIYSALADADTTAAQAFLAGGLEPPPLTQRYNDDLAKATTALTSAARRTSDGGKSADDVRLLSSGIARYAALVATARADNRQGLPIGSSYLSAAATLNRDTLLPLADDLFRNSAGEVDDAYAAAAATGWRFLLVLLLLGLLGTLIAAQRYLSRRTHRTFNLPLLGATLVTALLALLAGGVFVAQSNHLGRAGHDGSDPVALLARGRIMALQVRGDEALGLAAHGAGTAYEKHFTATAAELSEERGPLTNSYAALDAGLGETMNRATSGFQDYVALHKKVHDLDTGGDYDGAVALAVGPQTTRTFDSFRADLDSAIENRKAVFNDQIGAAGHGLGLLLVLGPLLALLICGLAYAGIRTRLEEYR